MDFSSQQNTSVAFLQGQENSPPILRMGYDPLSASSPDSSHSVLQKIKDTYFKDSAIINYDQYAELKKIQAKQTSEFVPPAAFSPKSEQFLKSHQYLQYLKEKESNFGKMGQYLVFEEASEEKKDTPLDEVHIRQEIKQREMELAWLESVQKEIQYLTENPAQTQELKQILANFRKSQPNEHYQFLVNALSLLLSTLIKESTKLGQKTAIDLIDRMLILTGKINEPFTHKRDPYLLNFSQEITNTLIPKLSSVIHTSKSKSLNSGLMSLLMELVRLVPTLKNVYHMIKSMEKSSTFLTLSDKHIKDLLKILEAREASFSNNGNVLYTSPYFQRKEFQDIFFNKQVQLVCDGCYFYALLKDKLYVIGTGEDGTILGHIYEDYKITIEPEPSRQIALCKGQIIIYNSKWEVQMIPTVLQKENQQLKKAIADIFAEFKEQELFKFVAQQSDTICVITISKSQSELAKYTFSLYDLKKDEIKNGESQSIECQPLPRNEVYMMGKLFLFIGDEQSAEINVKSKQISRRKRFKENIVNGCSDFKHGFFWILRATENDISPYYLEKSYGSWDHNRQCNAPQHQWALLDSSFEDAKVSQYKHKIPRQKLLIHCLAKSYKRFRLPRQTIINKEGRLSLEFGAFGGVCLEFLDSLMEMVTQALKQKEIKSLEEFELFQKLVVANSQISKIHFCNINNLKINFRLPVEVALKCYENAKCSQYLKEQLKSFIALLLGLLIRTGIYDKENSGSNDKIKQFNDLLPYIFQTQCFSEIRTLFLKETIFHYSYSPHISKLCQYVLNSIQHYYLNQLTDKFLCSQLLSFLDFLNYYIASMILYTFTNKKIVNEFKDTLAKFFEFFKKMVAELKKEDNQPESVKSAFLQTRACWHLNNLLTYFLHYKLIPEYIEIVKPIINETEELLERFDYLEVETGYDVLFSNLKALQSLIWRGGKEKKGPRLPPTSLFPPEMEIDEKIQIVQKSQFLLNSTLFSGGIPLASIKSLSSNISSICKSQRLFGEQNLQEQEFPVNFKNLPNGHIIEAIVNCGSHAATDTFIDGLCRSYGKIKPQSLVGGKEGLQLTRYAFVAMLKYASLLGDFDNLVQESSEGTQIKVMYEDVYKKLEQKWAAASQMREWLVGQKNKLAQKNQLKEDSLKLLLEKVKERLQFLLQFQRPGIWELDPQGQDDQSSRAPVLIRASSSRKSEEGQNESYGGLMFHNLESIQEEGKAEPSSKIAQWRKKIRDWHLMEKSKRVIKNFQLSEAQVFSHVTTSVLAYLQIDLPLNVISHQLCQNYEIVCLRAQLVKTLSTSLNQSISLSNYFAASGPLVKKLDKPGEPKHYLRGIKGCGAQVVNYLRELFFEMINKLLQRVCEKEKLAENEPKQLMYYLNWKYTARDHSKIYETKLVEIMAGKIKSALASSWITEEKNKSNPFLKYVSKTVQQTFYEIILQIALRSSTEEQESKGHDESMITVPSLHKFKSALNVNHSEALLQTGLQHLLTQLHLSAQLDPSQFLYEGGQQSFNELNSFLIPLLTSLSQLIKLMSASSVTSPLLLTLISSQSLQDLFILFSKIVYWKVKIIAIQILAFLLDLLPFEMYLEATHSLKCESVFQFVYEHTLNRERSDSQSLLLQRVVLAFLRQLISSHELSSFKFIYLRFEEVCSSFDKSQPSELSFILEILGGQMRAYREGQRVRVHYYEDMPLEQEGVIVAEEQGQKISVAIDKAEIQCTSGCLTLLKPDYTEEVIQCLDQPFVLKLTDLFFSLASSETQTAWSVNLQIKILKILQLKQAQGYQLKKAVLDFIGEQALRFTPQTLKQRAVTWSSPGYLESHFFKLTSSSNIALPKYQTIKLDQTPIVSAQEIALKCPLIKLAKSLTPGNVQRHPADDYEASINEEKENPQYQTIQHILKLKLCQRLIFASVDNLDKCRVNIGMLYLFLNLYLKPYTRLIKQGQWYLHQGFMILKQLTQIVVQNEERFLTEIRSLLTPAFAQVREKVFIDIGYGLILANQSQILFKQLNGSFLFQYVLNSAFNLSLGKTYKFTYHSWYLHSLVARILEKIEDFIPQSNIYPQLLSICLLPSNEYHQAISSCLAVKSSNQLSSFTSPMASMWVDVARYLARIQFKKLRLFSHYQPDRRTLQLLVKNQSNLKEILYTVDTNRQELSVQKYFVEEMKPRIKKAQHWFECTSSLSLYLPQVLSILLNLPKPLSSECKRLKDQIITLRDDQGSKQVIRLDQIQEGSQASLSNNTIFKIENCKSLSPLILEVQDRSQNLDKIVESKKYFNELEITSKYEFKVKKSFISNGYCYYLLQSGHLVGQYSNKAIRQPDTKLIAQDIADFGFHGTPQRPYFIYLTRSGDVVIQREFKRVYQQQATIANGEVQFLNSKKCVLYSDREFLFFHIEDFSVQGEEYYEIGEQSQIYFYSEGATISQCIKEEDLLYVKNPRPNRLDHLVIPLPDKQIKHFQYYNSKLYAISENGEMYSKKIREESEWQKMQQDWPKDRSPFQFSKLYFNLNSWKLIGAEVISETEFNKRLIAHKQFTAPIKEEVKVLAVPAGKNKTPVIKKTILRPPSGALRPATTTSNTPRPVAAKRPLVVPKPSAGFPRKQSTPFKRVGVNYAKKEGKTQVAKIEVKKEVKVKLEQEQEKKKIEEDEPKKQPEEEKEGEAIWLYQISLQTTKAIIKHLDYIPPKFQLLNCSMDTSNKVTKLLKHKNQASFTKARAKRQQIEIQEYPPSKSEKFTYVCGYPIEKNKSQILEHIAAQIDKALGQEVGQPRYICSCKVEALIIEHNLSQAQFQARQKELFRSLPLIFIKTKCALPDEAVLPRIQLGDYYKTQNLLISTEIEVIPGLILPPQDIEEEEEKQGSQESMMMVQLEQQLMAMKQPIDKCKELDRLQSFIKDDFKIKDEKQFKMPVNLVKEKLTREATRHFKVLQSLCVANFRALQHLPSSSISHRILKKIEKVPFILRNAWLRMMFVSMKRGRALGWIEVDRFKAKSLSRKGLVDSYGHFTLFAQTMDHVDQKCRSRTRERYNCLKIRDCGSNPWQYKFTGEKGYDIGGLTREGIDEIACELQSRALSMLIPTPNNRNESGEMRECWMVNPVEHNIRNKEMLRFLGGMLAMTLSGDRKINLDFTSLLYKKITGQEANDEDLKEIDHFALKSLENLEQLVEEEGLRVEDVCEEYFTTCISNGEQVELIPGGESVQLKNENLKEYISRVKETRIAETNKAMKILMSGFKQVLGITQIRLVLNPAILKLFKAHELKKLIEGSREITVEGLKRITDEPESAEAKKKFWKVFKTLSQSDRAKYLRFVWGRSRLPHEAESLSEKHKIDVVDSKGDKRLPVGHTCFFTLDLPNYSKEETMRKKLLYSINNCQAIDGDSTAFVAFYDEDNL